MNVIFIPTDFQKNFLELIPFLAKEIENPYSEIIIGHLFKAKDYEQLHWKKEIDFKRIDPLFIQACKQSFLTKNNVLVKNFAGSSIAGLKHFFEANRVDLILNPIDYSFKKISKYSISNPGKILKRSGCLVKDVPSH